MCRKNAQSETLIRSSERRKETVQENKGIINASVNKIYVVKPQTMITGLTKL